MKPFDTVPNLFQQGHPIIMYDCGGDAALLCLSYLKAKYHCQPTALCDSHKNIQGKYLHNLQILSPENAIQQFPNAYWIITNFLDRAPHSKFLTELGIPQERIINYEPFEEKFSCRFLSGYCHVMNSYLNFCCKEGYAFTSPCTVLSPDLEQCLLQFQSTREGTIARLGNGTSCDRCPHAKTGIYSTQNKIELINFGGHAPCNFRCSYCHTKTDPNSIQRSVNFKELFIALKNANLLSDEVHVQFNAGEISIDKHQKEMFDVLGDTTVSVLTNSYVFSPYIADALLKGKAVVNTSVDAGTRETFKKVKGVDGWERVCETLSQYAAICKSNIVLKYIFLPGINDNQNDVDGFLQLCQNYAGLVQISSDLYHPELITDTTRQFFSYMKEHLDKSGQLYHLSNDISL